MLTDRGPTLKGKKKNEKVFPVPSFTPHIGKFKIENNSLVLVKDILLKDKNGNNLSGIPISTNTEKLQLILMEIK